jgi:hypothetical protein
VAFYQPFWYLNMGSRDSFWIWLDTDRNPGTGVHLGDVMGADYILSFKYSGTNILMDVFRSPSDNVYGWTLLETRVGARIYDTSYDYLGSGVPLGGLGYPVQMNAIFSTLYESSSSGTIADFVPNPPSVANYTVSTPSTTTTTKPPTTTTMPTTTTTAPTTTTTTQPQRFPDVPAWHPYATQINDLAARDIIVGNPDGTFGPEDWVKRQQFAKMIVLTQGLPTSESNVCPFGDLDISGPTGLYPDNYVAVCAGKGITIGTGPGKFSPWNEITRAQLITMVGRAAGLPDPPAGYNPPFNNFSDTHYPWARRAAYAGLPQGLQGFGPNWDFWAPATRGEVATILYNMLHQ